MWTLGEGTACPPWLPERVGLQLSAGGTSGGYVAGNIVRRKAVYKLNH